MKQDLERYREVLAGCSLFRGLAGEALYEAVEGLGGRVARYERGETIYRPGGPVRRVGIVLEGRVVIEANDADGDRTNLNMLTAGEEFGAYLVVSGFARSPMHVFAGTECAVLLVDILRLQQLDAARSPGRQLYNNLLKSFADKCVDLYSRVQIYGKKRIRSRIRIYLMSLPRRDGEIELPMNRTALAAYLGVDRTALARELTRMQEEGILSLQKRRVRILKPDFLPFPPPFGGIDGKGDKMS